MTDNVEKTEKDFHIICFLYMFVSCLCYCCFISLYQPFMKIWVGDSAMLPDYVMIMFSVYFLVERSENILSTYYDACGLWWHGKWKGIVEAAINLVLNIVLCYLFGIVGIILATIVSVCFVSIPTTSYFLHKKYFKGKNAVFLFKFYIQILLFSFVGLGVYFLTYYIPTVGSIFIQVLFMIIRLLVSILVPIVFVFIASLKSKNIKSSFSWLFKHIRFFTHRG